MRLHSYTTALRSHLVQRKRCKPLREQSLELHLVNGVVRKNCNSLRSVSCLNASLKLTFTTCLRQSIIRLSLVKIQTEVRKFSSFNIATSPSFYNGIIFEQRNAQENLNIQKQLKVLLKRLFAKQNIQQMKMLSTSSSIS